MKKKKKKRKKKTKSKKQHLREKATATSWFGGNQSRHQACHVSSGWYLGDIVSGVFKTAYVPTNINKTTTNISIICVRQNIVQAYGQCRRRRRARGGDGVTAMVARGQ